MVKMRQRHLCVFEFEKGSFDEILAYIQYNADFMRDRLLAFHDDITPEIRDFLCDLGAMPFKVENKKILQSGKVKQLITEAPIQDQSTTSHDDKQNTAVKKIKITLDSNDSAHVVMDSNDENLNQKNIESVSISNTLQDSDSKDSKLDSTPIKDSIKQARNGLISDIKSMPMVTFKRTIRSGEEIILESHATFIKDIHEGALIKSSGNLHIYGKCHGILECFGDYIIIGEFDMGRISLQNIIVEGKMLEKLKSSKKLKMLTIENGKISLCELL